MKTKLLLLFVLCLFQAASVSALTSFTSTTVEGVEVTYTIIDGNANAWVEVRKPSNSNAAAIATSTEGVVTIPEGVYYIDRTYTVVRIGENAFRGCNKVTRVNIPSHVTSIGSYAFSGCTSLESFEFDHGNLTTIESSAFNNCSQLTVANLSNSINSIGSSAFAKCSGLTSVNIPTSLESLPTSIFKECTSLGSITIPANITSIGGSAFSNCTSLASVNIQGSVTSIGSGAFGYCSSLTTINLPNTITSLSGSAFGYCTSLQSITLPPNITTLEGNTFISCSSLGSIVIPHGVTSIGYAAFSGCSNLLSVTIPSTVTSVDNYAFRSCSKLQTLIVPDIGAWCGISFGGESASSNPLTLSHRMYAPNGEEITSITIPSGVTSIKFQVFRGWTALSSVTIPSTVTSIGNYAFSGCSGLTSVNIPNSVTDIGSNAFNGCSGLTSVHISTSLTQIKSHVFAGCSGLTSIDIPEGITYIGEGAFSTCSNMTSVSIPSTLTRMGHSAFGTCKKLTAVKVADIAAWCGVTFDMLSDYPGTNPVYYAQHLYDMDDHEYVDLVIPEDVTTISGSFYNCKGLRSVEIPSTVTSIASHAFKSCTNLESVYSKMETPPTLNTSSFDRGSSPKYTNSRLVLLAGTAEGYAAQGWTSSYFRGGVVVPVTIGEAGAATLCSNNSLDFSGTDDIKAYIATDLEPGLLTLTRQGKMPAGSGMVLMANPGVYYVPVTTEELEVASSMLVGVLADTQLNQSNAEKPDKFILGKDGDDIGFFPAVDGSTLAAGKAYLALGAEVQKVLYGDSKLRCVFKDDLADGIGGVRANATDADGMRCYNLQGQPVTTPRHGIYIVNGKKVFVK